MRNNKPDRQGISARVQGSLTVEATFVITFLCLIIISSLTFTVSMVMKISDYEKRCLEAAEKDYRIYDTLRLERMIIDVFGE